MARPNEYVDLKTTCVTVERQLLEEAKKLGLNVSDVLRNALATRIGEVPKKQKSRTKKFKGLPTYVVNRAKKNIISGGRLVPVTIDWLRKDYGVNCSVEDLQALLPRY